MVCEMLRNFLWHAIPCACEKAISQFSLCQNVPNKVGFKRLNAHASQIVFATAWCWMCNNAVGRISVLILWFSLLDWGRPTNCFCWIWQMLDSFYNLYAKHRILQQLDILCQKALYMRELYKRQWKWSDFGSQLLKVEFINTLKGHTKVATNEYAICACHGHKHMVSVFSVNFFIPLLRKLYF